MMLKPWVAQALFWIFKAGIAVSPALLIWLRWFARENWRGRGWVAAICLWLAVVLAGWVHSMIVTIIAYTVLCAAFFGLLTLLGSSSMLSLLLAVPWGAAVVIFQLTLSRTESPLVPFYEQRLDGKLLCRAYSDWEDSIPTSRLVLLRQGAVVKDEELAVLHGFWRDDPVSCLVLPDGRVQMKITATNRTDERQQIVAISSSGTVTVDEH